LNSKLTLATMSKAQPFPRGLCLRPQRKCQSKSTTPLMIARTLPRRSTMDAGVLQQMNAFFGNFIRAESTGFVPERFR
jgi:hypothetical protein